MRRISLALIYYNNQKFTQTRIINRAELLVLIPDVIEAEDGESADLRRDSDEMHIFYFEWVFVRFETLAVASFHHEEPY